jgi:hypothetical protein
MTQPPRCVLANVSTGESMPCLFNPAQLTEKLQVNWNRQVVPGLSHQVLQFQSTSNRQLTGVEFYLDRFFATEQPGEPNILEFRGFLRALTAPPANTTGVLSTAPPRVLLIWPNVVTIECIVASVDFQYRQLAVDSKLLAYTASVTFEEVLDRRVTSEDLRRQVS